ARTCWDTGLRLQPHNVELLTNLARIRSSPGVTVEDVMQASDFIEQAEHLAERTWHWWEPVRAQVDEARKEHQLPPMAARTPGDTHRSFVPMVDADIDVAAVFRQICGHSWGVSFDGKILQTGDTVLAVESEGNHLVLYAPAEI